MENTLTSEFELESEKLEIDELEILSVWKFSMLTILSLGLYQVWWFYKVWRFFRLKEDLDIMPVARAVFSIFFLIPMLNNILHYAREKGYQGNYHSAALFLGIIALNLCSRLPDPLWLISFLSFTLLIAPLKALNYALTNDEEIVVVRKDGFNSRQIILMSLGAVVWALAILGLFVQEG